VLVAVEEEHEERKVRIMLSEQLRPFIPAMLHNMDAIAQIDLSVQKAALARRYGAVLPVITENQVDFAEMTNPQIADSLKKRGNSFTPISLALCEGATVITGANMGGKSVAMKTVALNILLVHCGFFPFAKEAACPIFDSMHIISEDLENTDRGLSSFGGEIVRFNEVLSHLDEGFAFIMLDEFARGTNPDEGAAIVQAVTAYLNKKHAVTLLATHYDNVSDQANAHYQVIGLKDLNVEELRAQIAAVSGHVGVELISKHMNYGLYRVEGKQNCPRDALNICRLLALNTEILEMIEKSY
jgi:dsDNA-specific endonuclease/ATPase MutS2